VIFSVTLMLILYTYCH